MGLQSPRFLLCSLALLLTVFVAGAQAAPQRYKRTVENYVTPDVVLINQEGRQIEFKELLESDKPVLLDFIYGTCTTICPVLSAGYSNLQRKLDPAQFHLVSISIDPEHDTPEVMKDYLDRYRAKPGWDFLTGSRRDIDQVMHAFDAYVQDKMSHYPLTLIRSPKNGKWVRIYGLVGTSDLIREVQAIHED